MFLNCCLVARSNFNKATKAVNLTRNPALHVLAQTSSNDGPCPTKRDVRLHYSGRSVSGKHNTGAIRYRLPLPINVEGDIVLVATMLARAAKNGSAGDMHAMINVGGGTPQVESFNPGKLQEVRQAWISPGAAPEEYMVRLRVVQPTWQWPNFVPGALSVSGVEIEFYGSMFVEVHPQLC